MTPDVLREWASALTFTTGCILVIAALVLNKVITKGHHDESMKLKDEIIQAVSDDCEKGWQEADKARKDLAENNRTLERALEALQRAQQARRG
jgi:hypothetical protein